MTFCSFVAQLAVWLLNVTSAASASPRLAAAADDASCAVLPLATAVTILFYALVFAGGPGLVIESTAVGRPRWLSPTMHLCNAAFAWADLALCAGRRSFSAAARKACVGLFVAYAVWQLVVRLVVGSYSYPVLNALPHPWGWVGAAAVGRGFAGAGLAAGAAFTRAARLLTGGAAAARARGG